MEGAKHQNPNKYLKLCLLNRLWLCYLFFQQIRGVSSARCKSSCLSSQGNWQDSVSTKVDPGLNTTLNGSAISRTQLIEAVKVVCTSPTPDIILKDKEKKIKCCFSGQPTPQLVHWYRNGEKVVNGSKGIYEYQRSRGKYIESTLLLPPGRGELEGFYQCSATNQESDWSSDASERLQVKFKCPTQILHHPIISASKFKFSTIKLTCLYEQNEDCPHQILWYRQGKEKKLLEKSAKYRIQEKQVKNKCEEVSVLSILNVTENDEGNYSCIWTCEYHSNLTAFIDLKLPPPDPPILNTTIANKSTKFTAKPPSHFPSGGTKNWLLPVIIISAATLTVIIMSLVRLLVKKKSSSTFKLGKYGLKEAATLNRLFISFSSKDLAWTNENLISIFEKHSIAYSIHSRDFELGKPIVQNMADNVYGSRQVLIVLSQNYLASNFCREELHMAVQRGIDSGDSSLILVMINNLKKKQLPAALRNKKMLDFDKHKKKQDWEEKILSEIVDGQGQAADSYTSRF